jgi:hypothetical protein
MKAWTSLTDTSVVKTYREVRVLLFARVKEELHAGLSD